MTWRTTHVRATPPWHAHSVSGQTLERRHPRDSADGAGQWPELKRAVHGISDSAPSSTGFTALWAGRAGSSGCVDEGPPIAVSYGLTPAGQALLPVLRGLPAR